MNEVNIHYLINTFIYKEHDLRGLNFEQLEELDGSVYFL